MELYLDCYPCVLYQTMAACRALNIPEETQKDIFFSALEILSNADPEKPPVELTADVHAAIKRETGIEDLYKSQKDLSTAAALSLYGQAKEIINQSRDPFESAVRLSIAGNVIDFGISRTFDLPSEIKRVLKQPFAINDMDELRAELDKAGDILYLADNAGETVFDKLLIETIGKEVTYAVKSFPILNDALVEDAEKAGIGEVAKIVTSGVDSPGTLLSRANDSFLDIYHHADLIISKGQGNFEALSNREENIFFILQAKCETLTRTIGAPVGGLIVKSARK